MGSCLPTLFDLGFFFIIVIFDLVHVRLIKRLKPRTLCYHSFIVNDQVSCIVDCFFWVVKQLELMFEPWFLKVLSSLDFDWNFPIFLCFEAVYALKFVQQFAKLLSFVGFWLYFVMLVSFSYLIHQWWKWIFRFWSIFVFSFFI